MNRFGTALVVWSQDQGDGSVSNGPKDTWAVAYSAETGWGTRTRLNSQLGSDAEVYGQVAVGIDDAGNGAALWVQQDGTYPFVVWASRYASTSGWGTAEVITAGATGDCYGPSIAVSSGGQAVATWQQQTGMSSFTAVRRMSAQGVWGASQVASDQSGDTYETHAAIDALGNAKVVWYQRTATGFTVHSSQGTSQGPWSQASLIATLSIDPWANMLVPRVAMNDTGKTFVIWGNNEM